MAPSAIIDGGSERAVGMTIYGNLDPGNRRLEIGSTGLSRASPRTGVNTAAKPFLLTRAFEELECIAVELRTQWHNHQSRTAIEKLGAKQDRVLRTHTFFENGTLLDTVVFSISDNEWPSVEFALPERVNRKAT